MDFETDVRFQCPRCENDVAVNVLLPEPIWRIEKPAVAEPQATIVTCPVCHEELRARVVGMPTACSLGCIDHPLTPVIASPPIVRDVYDDFDYYDVLAEARLLLDEKGGDGGSLVNRMVFAHYIGAFEAFLSDTLINEVLANEGALKKLIEGDEQLRLKRFSLSQIAASSDLIKNTVRTRLHREVWHRIKKARALYNTSFGIDIREMLGKDYAIIDQAVILRHDCVHRNGRDKDGTQLTDFTKEYIHGVGGILSRLAHNIVQAFNERRAESFFNPPPSEPM